MNTGKRRVGDENVKEMNRRWEALEMRPDVWERVKINVRINMRRTCERESKKRKWWYRRMWVEGLWGVGIWRKEKKILSASSFNLY